MDTHTKKENKEKEKYIEKIISQHYKKQIFKIQV